MHTYIYMHIDTCNYMYAYMNVYARVYTLTYVRLYMHIDMYTHIHIHRYRYGYRCACVRACVCARAHTHTYTHTHTHTHTHIYIYICRSARAKLCCAAAEPQCWGGPAREYSESPRGWGWADACNPNLNARAPTVLVCLFACACACVFVCYGCGPAFKSLSNCSPKSVCVCWFPSPSLPRRRTTTWRRAAVGDAPHRLFVCLFVRLLVFSAKRFGSVALSFGFFWRTRVQVCVVVCVLPVQSLLCVL
jgi:hypothetical protein